MGRLLRHIRLQHNNRTPNMYQHDYIKASLFCLFPPGALFFSGCMISKENYLERPVAQMHVLKCTAFCCANYSVWGSCSLFVASPILVWETLYDSSFIQLLRSIWTVKKVSKSSLYSDGIWGKVIVCPRNKRPVCVWKTWLLCQISSSYYTVRESDTAELCNLIFKLLCRTINT